MNKMLEIELWYRDIKEDILRFVVYNYYFFLFQVSNDNETHLERASRIVRM